MSDHKSAPQPDRTEGTTIADPTAAAPAEAAKPVVKYDGNCHCGAVKFQILLPQLESVYTCHCGYCFKKHILWVYGFYGKDLTFERGEEALTVYQFGPKTYEHKVSESCRLQAAASCVKAKPVMRGCQAART